jgi:hypothetical protein
MTDIESATIDYLNGKLHILNLTIKLMPKSNLHHLIQLAYLLRLQRQQYNCVPIPFLNAQVKGQYKISKITDVLYSVSQYYNSEAIAPKAVKENQNFNFKISVNDSPIN